jgi:hypothetical protein
MPTLLKDLRKSFPAVQFVPSDSFYWSPRKRAVHYNPDVLQTNQGDWSLLHELGHALLEHQSFNSDYELVKLELSAWEKAKELADNHAISIDPDHIEDCLDSYRDWLYLRSTCPTCSNCSQQIDAHTYRCFNCNGTWQVSSSRKCRSYRKKLVVKI